MKFLLYQNWSDLIKYICDQTDQDFIDSLQNGLSVERIFLNTWSEITNHIDTVSLFKNNIKSNIKLINVQDLKLDKNAEYFLSKIKENQNIFLYSPNIEKLLADEKKKWSKIRVEVIELKKPDTKNKLDFLQKYIKKDDINLSPQDLKIIAEKSNTFDEVVDLIDMAKLSEQPSQIVGELNRDETVPLFFLSLNTNDWPKSISRWYSAITSSDDVQLGLSMLYTKSDRIGNLSKQIKREIIDTDYRIKSGSKLSSIANWKLLIWKLKQMQ